MISIGDNTHIEWNVIILPGVKTGKNCIIVARAVVIHDIPDNSVAVGVPTKVIENINEYYEKFFLSVIIRRIILGRKKRHPCLKSLIYSRYIIKL